MIGRPFYVVAGDIGLRSADVRYLFHNYYKPNLRDASTVINETVVAWVPVITPILFWGTLPIFTGTKITTFFLTCMAKSFFHRPNTRHYFKSYSPGGANRTRRGDRIHVGIAVVLTGLA